VPIRLLAIGLPLTILLGLAVAVVILPGIGLLTAFLLAVLLAPTDAGLGAAVVADPRIPMRIRQEINVESGLNDGIVTPLVLLAVAVAAAEPGGEDPAWVRFALSEIGWGVIVGIVLGVGGALLVRRAMSRDLLAGSVRWAIAPALAVIAWTLTPAMGGNAFIAAFTAGLAATATVGPASKAFAEFGETLGEVAGLAVFFLFGLLVPLIGGYSIPVVAYAVLSLTIIRMLPVAISLIGTRLSAPTVAFIGWFGPRGLASIVLTLLALGDGDVPTVPAEVAATVAATVFLSVLLHGLSAGPLTVRYGAFAKRLPDTAPEHHGGPDLATRRHHGGPAHRMAEESPRAAT
jgi:NhaP-type Na+/H+ or K+/H+ antiporter